MKGKSGIYRIVNLVNSKCYIGSALDFYKRYYNHFSRLKKGNHYNNHLQSAIDKYGIENFRFEILINCPKEYLIKAEQWFIDNLKPEYNIRKIAESNRGVKLSEKHKELVRNIRKGIKLTQEHKDAIRDAHKGKKHSLETKLKMSNLAKGKPKSDIAKLNMSLAKLGKRHSEETKRKMSISKSKKF